MSDVTRLLNAVEQGDPKAAEELLPLVYDELRKLAAAKMAQQPDGQTLQATALVHEAWLRLVGGVDRQFASRRHFFSAAAQAISRPCLRWQSSDAGAHHPPAPRDAGSGRLLRPE